MTLIIFNLYNGSVVTMTNESLRYIHNLPSRLFHLAKKNGINSKLLTIDYHHLFGCHLKAGKGAGGVESMWRKTIATINW